MNFLDDYEFSTEFLEKDGISATVADLYGIVLGLISGGVKQTDKEFWAYIEDLENNGEELKSNSKDWIKQLADYVTKQLLQGEGIKLLLPKDDNSLEVRIIAFTELVNSFLVGFSCKQKLHRSLSHDIQEFLRDLSDIGNMDTSVENSDDSMEADYEVLVSHVSVGAQICFEECASSLYPNEKDFILSESDEESKPVELSDERKTVHALESQFWEKQAKIVPSEKRFE
ncbi:MAG: UPF0149 family protein [Succinivibrionaceae bacterium]